MKKWRGRLEEAWPSIRDGLRQEDDNKTYPSADLSTPDEVALYLRKYEEEAAAHGCNQWSAMKAPNYNWAGKGDKAVELKSKWKACYGVTNAEKFKLKEGLALDLGWLDRLVYLPPKQLQDLPAVPVQTVMENVIISDHAPVAAVFTIPSLANGNLLFKAVASRLRTRSSRREVPSSV
jgi:hypothetical protein